MIYDSTQTQDIDGRDANEKTTTKLKGNEMKTGQSSMDGMATQQYIIPPF